MQRRHVPKSEKNEPGEQRWTKGIDEESAGVDHESEDTSEAAALGVGEPRRIDLHHAGRAERLEVAVDAANQDEDRQYPPKRRDPEKQVHRDRSGRADEHRPLAAEAIS